MNGYPCLECGLDFPSRRSLHCHIKAHACCLGDYYIKYIGKRDLLTQELIPYHNYDQYIRQDFICRDNFKQWLQKTNNCTAKAYVLSKAKEKFAEKNVRFSPQDSFYILAQMADIREYKRIFGSYKSFLDELGIEVWFKNLPPKNFWEEKAEDMPILIDTREQKPLSFPKEIISKLDFGDYTAEGDFYSKTFVDRKSPEDFKQTFGADVGRFHREMDRCVQFGSYMFVVVESSIEKIEEENGVSSHRSKLGFVWHNVRETMLKYPQNLQFIFAQSRAGAKKIIPKILFFGDKLWRTDVQFFIDEKIYGDKGRLTRISN